MRERTREACAQELGRVFIQAADEHAPIGYAGSVWLQPYELRRRAQRDLPWDWLYDQLHRWVMASVVEKRPADSLDPDGRRPEVYRLRPDARKLVERWLLPG